MDSGIQNRHLIPVLSPVEAERMKCIHFPRSSFDLLVRKPISLRPSG